MSDDLAERLVQYVIIGVLALGIVATSPVTIPLACIGWVSIKILEMVYPQVGVRKKT